MDTSAVPVISAIISALSTVTMWKRSRDERKARLSESLESELKEFGNNFLSWYNEIADLAVPLVADLRQRGFSEGTRRNYLKSLRMLKERDKYISKCQRFVTKSIPSYVAEKLVETTTKEQLEAIGRLYWQLEVSVLSLKGGVWETLNRSGGTLSLKERRRVADWIDSEFVEYRKHKQALAALL